MKRKTILVLNMGMKSIRSIIFDEEGNKLASSALPIVTSLRGEMVTQSPTEWWSKACEVIRETLSEAGDVSIDYLTVTSSSSCLVCVDRSGRELLPCMMVSDRRAKGESDFIMATPSFPSVKERTGLGMDASLLLPKALWLKNHEKGIYGKVDKFLSPNDYLIMKFTGKYVTDYMNAQKWHYDTEKKQYPLSLLEEIGISPDLLPEVVNPGTCVGTVSKTAAEETGLTTGTQVIASTYDAICSFVGSGVLKNGGLNKFQRKYRKEFQSWLERGDSFNDACDKAFKEK